MVGMAIVIAEEKQPSFYILESLKASIKLRLPALSATVIRIIAPHCLGNKLEKVW